MTTSILLRPPHPSPGPSPSPSPSPVSTPLPGLQTDISSSSSSTSSSYLDLHRASSARSAPRIRFAPLPEPERDPLDIPSSPSADLQSPNDLKSLAQPAPLPCDPHDSSVPLTPSISPDSAPSSIRSTPTIRQSPTPPQKSLQKSGLKLLRAFPFLRRADASPSAASPPPYSGSLPSSRSPSVSSFTPHSNSMPSSPSFQSKRLPRISEDILSLGQRSFFHARSGSSSSVRPPRTPSPHKRSDSSKSLHRSASTGSSPAIKQVDGKRDWGVGPAVSLNTAPITGSGPKKRRASSSALTPGAGGGRHTASVQKPSSSSAVRPSTAPSSLLAPPRKHVKMLNGRVYGAKRAAQTLADPFANVRDDPEFVEWGYGGMGSVQASAGIGSDMWRGLQRSERGGALLAGSSSTPVNPPAGVGGDNSGARSTTARRKMSDNVPECGMGNVSSEYGEDDGSGLGWVKKRRAEREAKARLEQAKHLVQEKRKSGDSAMDASMSTSTASTTTSLTACTSAASTDLTTPTTSPLASRSPSMSDLKVSSPSLEPPDLRTTASSTIPSEQSSGFVTAQSILPSKDEHGHHVLTAVRLSPNPHRERSPSSPIDTEAGASSSSEEELDQGSDDGDEHGVANEDDDERQVQDVKRKTALGAGVEKISRHVEVEAR